MGTVVKGRAVSSEVEVVETVKEFGLEDGAKITVFENWIGKYTNVYHCRFRSKAFNKLLNDNFYSDIAHSANVWLLDTGEVVVNFNCVQEVR